MKLTVTFIAAFIASCNCTTIGKKTGDNCHEIVENVHVVTPIHCNENDTQLRITGGCEAEPHSIPWQVRLQLKIFSLNLI